MKRASILARLAVLIVAGVPSLVFPADPSTDIATHGAGMRSPADATRVASARYFQQYAGGIKSLVQALVSALNDKNADVRSIAARSLGEIGPSAQNSVPALIPLLNDRDESVRSSVAQALGDIGVPSTEALCGLANLLQDINPSVRGQAAQTLGKFGPVAAIHTAALQDLLADKSVETATSAAIALAAMGEPDPKAGRLYVLALNREHASRKLAESALRQLGAPGVDALIAVVRDEKDRSVRREAASMLVKMGSSARPAAATLKEALTDADLELQSYAAQALVELGDVPVTAATPLIRIMKDWNEFRPKALTAFETMNEHAADVPLALLKTKDDPQARRESARVLARLAPRFKTNPELLATSLNDVDETVRYLTVDALASSGAEPRTVAALLTPCLNDKSADVALLACKTLGGFAWEPAAICALADVRIHGSNSSVRNAAGRSVLAAGAKVLPALAALRSVITQDDAAIRGWALKSIENIGPAAAEAVPQLIECLTRFKASRAETAAALGTIGAPAIDALLPLLSASEPGMRSTAATALGRIGAPALAKLQAALSDANPEVVEAALGALEIMAPNSAPAIPELIRAANSKTLKIQYAASQALSKLGPLATPALIDEIKKPDDGARHAAMAALGLMGGKAVPLIVDALNTEREPLVLCALLDCLSRMGPVAADSVPAILSAAGRDYLPKDRSLVWTHCASALGAIGCARETAVPVLFKMMSVEDRLPHASAAAALHVLGGEEMRVPPLTDILKCASPLLVGSALKPFGRAGMLQLIAEMQSSSPEIRDASARAIAQLAPESLPFLLTSLDENPTAAVGILLAIGEVRMIEIDKRAIKTTLPKTLLDLQKALDLCTPALHKKIDSGTPDEALAALWALGKPCASGLERTVAAFAACSPDLRPRAMAALAYYDVAGKSRALVRVLPLMLKECGNGPVAIRKQNLALLQSTGFCPEGALELADALEDPSIAVRQAALAGIKSLGAEARSCVPKLIQQLEEGTPVVVLAASTALTTINSEAVPELVKAMRGANKKLRLNAYTLLHSMKLQPHLVLLAEAAGDDREDVAVAALQLISVLKEDARPAEAKVRALLLRDNDLVFNAAARTLSIMGVNVFSALAKHAENPNPAIALRAITAMNTLPKKEPGMIADFVSKQLKNEVPEIRAAAVVLLPGGEAGTPLSMPVIANAMKDPYYQVRVNAVVWLFDNAPFAPDAGLPLLVAGLNDNYGPVSTVSRNSLIYLGDKTRPMIPELQKLLSSPLATARNNAASVLIALGVEDALARVIHNEAGIAAEVELYHDEQEKFFEEHFTHENVHHFSTAALPLLGPAAKEHTKDVDADGNLNMLGYKMIVLTRQSAHADGGEKDWMANGVLSHGHALLAWPAQPGVTGRLAYMSGPDGALYERAVSGHDAALLDGIARAFDPAPEWKKTFTPIKGVKPAIPHSYFKPASPVADELEF